MPTIADLLGISNANSAPPDRGPVNQKGNHIRSAEKGGKAKKKEPGRKDESKGVVPKGKMRLQNMEGQAHEKTTCPVCGDEMPKHRLYAHLRKMPCSLKNGGLYNLKSNESRLVLYSKRGIRLRKEGACDNCGTVVGSLWYYSKSSMGGVHLCSVCKNKIYPQSHGKVDAWAVVVDKQKPRNEGEP